MNKSQLSDTDLNKSIKIDDKVFQRVETDLKINRGLLITTIENISFIFKTSTQRRCHDIFLLSGGSFHYYYYLF